MTTLSFPFPTASRTVLAPLTTVFTPAATCSSYVANGILAPTVDYWQAQACSDGAPVDALPCWPPALVQTSIPLHGRGFYSPGLSCPAGYTSACTAAQSTNGSPSPLALGTSFVFQYPLTAGETAIGCCPGGLTCGYGTVQSSTWQTCMSIVTSGPVDNVAFCDTSTIGTTQLISIPGPYVTDNSSTVTITKATLYGPLVQINFKATDISSLTPPMITTSKSAQPASATGGGYGSNSTAVTDQSGDSGLSTGAKIGIGVGVPLGVLLLAAIAAFFFLRRRKSKQGPVPIQRPLGDPSKANSPGGQGLHGQGAHAPHGKWQNMSEAPAGRPENIELDGRNMPSEAPPAELPADGPGYR